MKTEKVKPAIAKLSTDSFITRVQFICSKMVDTAFATIVPTAAEVLDKCNEMQTLQRLITNGNRGLIPQRNQVRSEVNTMVSRQCDGVNMLAYGDLTILNKSGMELFKKRTPLTVPPKVEKLTLSNANTAGDVSVSFSATEKRFVQVQACQNMTTESAWHIVAMPTKNKCVVTDMPVGAYTYFRVCAINDAGPGEWSDVVRLMVG